MDLAPAYLGFEPMTRTPALIQPDWSHVVAVGSRPLFYAQHDGSAATGHILPDGQFSGERFL